MAASHRSSLSKDIGGVQRVRQRRYVPSLEVR